VLLNSNRSSGQNTEPSRQTLIFPLFKRFINRHVAGQRT
jgi:hypothetical protein